MEKRILVQHLPYGENLPVSIPVRYSIDKINDHAIDLHCKIDLTEKERPDWLRLREFSISKSCTAYHPKVACVHYSNIPIGSIKEAGLPEAIEVAVRLSDPVYRDFGINAILN